MEDMEKIERGHTAQRLLEDPLLQECLAALENGSVARIKAADVNDTKTLQTLVMGLQAASGFRRQLEMIARTGKDAMERADEKAQTERISPFRRVIKHWTA